MCECALCFSRHWWVETKAFCTQMRAKEQGGPASFSVPGSSATEDVNRKMWTSHSFPKDRSRQDCVRKEGQASHGGQPAQLYRSSPCPKRGREGPDSTDGLFLSSTR